MRSLSLDKADGTKKPQRATVPNHPLEGMTGVDSGLFELRARPQLTLLPFFDRLAPRARSAAVRQNARPSGRGKGELYKNVYLPYRARKPAKRTPALQGGEASQSNMGLALKLKLLPPCGFG